LNKTGTGYTNFNGFNFGGSEVPHQPLGGLIEGLDGSLYGTTEQGGLSNKGTIFKINKDGTGATVLKSLGLVIGGGEQPNGTLLQAMDGQLYGTAALGGVDGFGAVIRISTNGTNFGIIHSFTGSEGQEPRAGLTESPNGILLGTTRVGGGADSGVVLRVTTNGNHATLHSFTGFSGDGARSRSRLLYRDGFYYGMTFGGGTSDQGVIFRLSVPGL
jgi:uncharacterized repeat protein (TIGR03803 family)